MHNWPEPTHRLAAVLLAVGLTAPPAEASGGKPPTTRLDERTPYIHIASSNPLGAIGKETADVSTIERCDVAQWRFDHAELVMHDNRFGLAAITNKPDAGCSRCEPLEVRWFHEPTGYISFSIHVHRRLYAASCASSGEAKHPSRHRFEENAS